MEPRLVVVAGPDQNKAINLRPGRNVIGRSGSAQLQVTDAAVSFEHAVVLVENGRITLENLSAGGTQVNGAAVRGSVKVSAKDRVRLSPATEIVLDYGEAGGGEQTSAAAMVMLAVVVLLLVVLAVVAVKRAAPSASTKHDWNGAYACMQKWVDEQASDGAMPGPAAARFRDGWRFERGQKHRDAAAAWLDITRMLAATRPPAGEDGATWSGLSAQFPRALKDVLQAGGDPGFDDEQAAAAFHQFVKTSLEYNTSMSQESP